MVSCDDVWVSEVSFPSLVFVSPVIIVDDGIALNSSLSSVSGMLGW
jgi:hypothetical protein